MVLDEVLKQSIYRLISALPSIKAIILRKRYLLYENLALSYIT